MSPHTFTHCLCAFSSSLSSPKFLEPKFASLEHLQQEPHEWENGGERVGGRVKQLQRKEKGERPLGRLPGTSRSLALILLPSVGKNLSDPNIRICPTRKETGYRQEFFVRILNPDIKFFTFLLSEPEFTLVRIIRPEKIGYRTSISCPNSDIVRIVQPEFDPNPNFCQRYFG